MTASHSTTLSAGLKHPTAGWLPHVWLVFLAYLFISPVLGEGSTLEWAATLGSIAVFLPLYFAQFGSRRGHPYRAFAFNVAIAVLGFALVPINPGGNTYIIYSAAGSAFALRPRPAMVYLVALSVATWLVMQFFAPASFRAWMLYPTIVLIASIGWTNIYQAERFRHDTKLRRAQEDVEEMAKVAERERIARDLHDLLGHTLSVITLKSELASKLADIDPQKAAIEIREVERVSRGALAEVRAAVEGFRSRGLSGELRSAEQALEAAGVGLETDIAPVPLSARQETTLALALREAITNVVRHSRATTYRVGLRESAGGVVFTIEDDGRGGPLREGIGLSGMRERVAAVGGALSIEGDRGLRLIVTVPADLSGSAVVAS
jgi:two-component system sensor histidine kinase DesK